MGVLIFAAGMCVYGESVCWPGLQRLRASSCIVVILGRREAGGQPLSQNRSGGRAARGCRLVWQETEGRSAADQSAQSIKRCQAGGEMLGWHLWSKGADVRHQSLSITGTTRKPMGRRGADCRPAKAVLSTLFARRLLTTLISFSHPDGKKPLLETAENRQWSGEDARANCWKRILRNWKSVLAETTPVLVTG